MTDHPSGGGRGRRGKKSGDEEPDPGFDRWLNRQLHGLYDPILAEAVPPEILKLIEQFDDRPASLKDPPPDGGERKGRDEGKKR